MSKGLGRGTDLATRINGLNSTGLTERSGLTDQNWRIQRRRAALLEFENRWRSKTNPEINPRSTIEISPYFWICIYVHDMGLSSRVHDFVRKAFWYFWDSIFIPQMPHILWDVYRNVSDCPLSKNQKRQIHYQALPEYVKHTNINL